MRKMYSRKSDGCTYYFKIKVKGKVLYACPTFADGTQDFSDEMPVDCFNERLPIEVEARIRMKLNSIN